MIGIRSQVSRELASRKFQRHRRGRLRSFVRWVFRKKDDNAQQPLAGERGAKLEKVWLPCHRVRFPLTKEGREGAFELLVGGHDAAVVRVKGGGLEIETVADREQFAPVVGIEEAVEIARQQLTIARVREPGWSNQVLNVGQPEVELWQYPYWAYYYERRKGMLDVLLLDAVTGTLVGSRTKAAFLTAITAAKP